MPSTIISAASGAPFPLVSGNPWSGQGTSHPIGEVRLCLDPSASGNAYISYSGDTTINSGGYFLSGGGLSDGMILKPGERYNVPKLCFTSGKLNVYVTCDAACSGRGRLYWDAF